MNDNAEIIYKIIKGELENEKLRFDRLERKAGLYITITNLTLTILTLIFSKVLGNEFTKAGLPKQFFNISNISQLLMVLGVLLLLAQLAMLLISNRVIDYPILEKRLFEILLDKGKDSILLSTAKANEELSHKYYEKNIQKAKLLDRSLYLYVTGMLISLIAIII